MGRDELRLKLLTLGATRQLKDSLVQIFRALTESALSAMTMEVKAPFTMKIFIS